jgi:exonuclease I
VGISDSLKKSAHKRAASVFSSLKIARFFKTRNTKLTEYALNGR